MTIISGIILLIALAITVKNPGAGLALSTQVYVLRNALIGSLNDAGGDTDPLLGILLPFLCFSIILYKSFGNLKKYKTNTLDILFLIFGLWMLVSSISTYLTSKGLEISIRYFVLGISFYFAARILPLVKNIDVQECFLGTVKMAWLLSVISACLGLFHLVVNASKVERFSIGSANPIPYAFLLGIGIIITVYWLYLEHVPLIRKAFLLTILALLSLMLMATNTRSMVVAIVMVLPAMVYQLAGRISILKYIKLILSTIIFVASIPLAISYFKPEIFSQWANKMLAVFSTEKDLSSTYRLNSAETAISLFKENSIFGVGTANFGHYDDFSYPHNLLLEVASEQGIFGLLIFLLIIFYVFKTALKCIETPIKSKIQIVFFIWFLFSFFVGQFSFTLWQHKFLFMSAGLIVSYKDYLVSQIRQCHHS